MSFSSLDMSARGDLFLNCREMVSKSFLPNSLLSIYSVIKKLGFLPHLDP
jgi:hypothetical protein